MAWLDDNPPNYMPGLRGKFLAILLTIAEQTGDRAEQIRLIDALFSDTGDMSLYHRLKTRVGPAAWPSYRPDFLYRLQALPGWRVDLGRIYAAEGLWAELLEFVHRHPTQLQTHHKDLAGQFPRELAAIYEQIAQQEIDQQPNRGGYQTACRYLLAMREVDSAGAATVVARWRVAHKNRPALQDELTNAFGLPAARSDVDATLHT